MAEESRAERVDREVSELVNELRVALPGVQVLFAFLLILPFQAGFDTASDLDRAVFMVAFLASALAAVLLLAPAAYLRVNFRAGRKEPMLFDVNAILLGAMALIALGAACAVFGVVDVVYGSGLAVAISIAVAAAIVALWVVWPLRRRSDPPPHEGGGPHEQG